MLLIGLVGTGCSGSGSPSPSATSGRLDAAAGGTVRLGLAAMEVPAGALSVNATASIRQVQDPPSVPVGLGTAYGFSLTPFALRPGKTVRLHLPIPDGVGTQGVQQALAYRDEKGQWIAVTATVDPNGKTATADVPHLSTWAFFDIGSWLTNTIKNAVRGHLEAAGPSVDCPGPTPYVSVESLSKDAPLAVCVQPAGPRRERVTLVNKRKFAVAVTPGVGLTRPNDFSLEVGQGFTTVPSAGQLTFELDSSVPATKVSYRPDYQYTAVETLAPALLGRAFLKNPGGWAGH